MHKYLDLVQESEWFKYFRQDIYTVPDIRNLAGELCYNLAKQKIPLKENFPIPATMLAIHIK